MEIAKHTGEENNIYAAYAEGILADCLYHKGSYKEAAEHYHAALKTYERQNKALKLLNLLELYNLWLGHCCLIKIMKMPCSCSCNDRKMN